MMTFALAVYLLCVLASVACAVLLGASYRRTRMTLLLWSALCFVLLAANNLVVVVDLIILPDIDLRLLRHACSLGAIFLLLVGFIWTREE